MGGGTTDEGRAPAGPPRRRVLVQAAGAAAGVALGWTPAFTVSARAADADVPPSFPRGVRLVRQAFRNWSGEVALDAVWTALPAHPADVLALADWARAHGWRLRAKGAAHTWSPILARAGEPVEKLVMVDTTYGLTAVRCPGQGPGTVTAQAGASLDAVLAALEDAGYALPCTPASGAPTLGGVLAIGGHGTGVPVAGPWSAAHSTVGDTVASLTAVVWDGAAGRHVLRRFDRSHPDTAAFLAHLGRAFVTEATLRVPPDAALRCRSSLDVPAGELFGPPGGRRALERFVARSGRVEALWMPYTRYPWLKVWTHEPVRPAEARAIRSPYPYPFYDTLPKEASVLLREVTTGAAALTPLFTAAVEQGIRLGLTATASWDLWGPSRSTLLYLRPGTVRWRYAGWAVLCARRDVQGVVHDVWSRVQALLAAHRVRGEFPLSGPFHVRIAGADAATPTGALLSPARARADRPEGDTVVWLNTVTFPGTPGELVFHRELEEWMLAHFAGRAVVRPEWPKAWGYGARGPWSADAALVASLPEAFGAGLPAGRRWEDAARVLDRHDPARVFRGPFLGELFPAP